MLPSSQTKCGWLHAPSWWAARSCFPAWLLMGHLLCGSRWLDFLPAVGTGVATERGSRGLATSENVT